MMLGQNGVKKDAKQRAAKNAREHDQADCDGTHLISAGLIPRRLLRKNYYRT
jgi:hypothetical protein